MLNRSASLAMSTSVLKALAGKLDIKRHSPSILYKHRLQTNPRHCGKETENTDSHNTTKVVSSLGSSSFENLDEFPVTNHIGITVAWVKVFRINSEFRINVELGRL